MDSPIFEEEEGLMNNDRNQSPVGRRIGPYQIISLLGRAEWEKSSWPRTPGSNARWRSKRCPPLHPESGSPATFRA